MREIVLDTETTGINAQAGDRVVEIGCVELLNHLPTGRTFHVYINPERAMPQEAFNVHGLSEAFLSDKPKFAEICEDFRSFIAGARLIIHNAAFDVGFLNAELARLGHPPIPMSDAVDTLLLARRKHPGAANSLDALCLRYGIDNSRRTRHGALLDAEILAEVYIELIGGRQTGLELTVGGTVRRGAERGETPQRPQPLPPRIAPAEIAAHEAFVATLGAEAVWRRYLPEPGSAA